MISKQKLINLIFTKSNPSLISSGPLQVLYFLFGLDVGKGILVDVFVFGCLWEDFLVFGIFLLLIEERIVKVSYGNAVPFEEPGIEPLDECGFELGDVIV